MFPKLNRFLEKCDKTEQLPPGMLGAFAACFTWEEAADALVHLIDAEPKIRRPVLNRVLRLAQEAPDATVMSALVRKLIAVADTRKRMRVRVGAILTLLFPHLPNSVQSEIIAYWIASPLDDSKGRWLKVVSKFKNYFDPKEILLYWLQSGDSRAVKLIAYDAPPEFVQEVLGDIIEHCSEGWIVSRAALRVPELSSIHLNVIKEKFPVSYVYLCAKTGMPLSETFAIDTFLNDNPSIFLGNRPLILWSIGHLGMWKTLERICELWPSIRDDQHRDTV